MNALAGATLDHSSPVPLYHQGGPASGRGDRGRPPAGGSTLESESDLAGRLGISCPTMRAAIKQLVDKGLLMRRRGIGTRVAPQPVRRAVALTSLYDDLKEAGREPEICVLAFEEARCPPDIAEHLDLEPCAPVLSFDWLRLANSGAHVPIASCTTSSRPAC